MPMNSYSIKNAEDRARLPKWAQQQIETLLRDNDSLRTQRDELLGQAPPDSDTFVDGGHVDPDRPLGRRPQINFGTFHWRNEKTGREGSHHIMDARWHDEEQELHVSSYSGTIKVIPWATNSIRISLDGK